MVAEVNNWNFNNIEKLSSKLFKKANLAHKKFKQKTQHELGVEKLG